MMSLYRGPADMPERIAVFPLPGVLLLPRSQLPLNIFEPRYLDMVNDAMSGERIIGMVQPAYQATAEEIGNPHRRPPLLRTGCAGRITSFAETDDGRILITLTGTARFTITAEHETAKTYRKCAVDFAPFAGDFADPPKGPAIARENLLRAFRAYLDANQLQADWQEVDQTPDEALVNGLAVLAPYGPKEKQALLEAPDLASRCDVLIALTEMHMAGNAAGGAALQ